MIDKGNCIYSWSNDGQNITSDADLMEFVLKIVVVMKMDFKGALGDYTSTTALLLMVAALW